MKTKMKWDSDGFGRTTRILASIQHVSSGWSLSLSAFGGDYHATGTAPTRYDASACAEAVARVLGGE